ncbi:metalloregulator ArsR/SmtB family transcription factor [Streptomyces sp. DT2A-34]|uniref:ArsR/SmtB family transcription factor n=1 Tax=Streptomyces sp. DT2A-34 TaxID=3051182 RepID=UPI00265B9045|nr:metalloregulator ArsR/SmtB family transcription factor [Streptomyces sp. DT2A-34]MDO0910628.1 metalloregulator ArsR/SmtB family transcription factor [Streptomyces sp. DT2A-34]
MREFAGDANFVDPAALMADPTRARILLSLLDRQSLAMSELAAEAGVAQSTTSAHLARLVDGDLLTVRSEGLHRYYSLASADVATALECLARLSPPFQPNSLRSYRRSCSLKAARTCYDHAAGDLGVTVMEGLLDRGAIARTGRGSTAYRVTLAGQEMLGAIKVHDTGGGSSAAVRHCVDWTSDKHHLAGRVGAAILSAFLAEGWVTQKRDSRILVVGHEGKRAIARWLGMAPERLTCS